MLEVNICLKFLTKYGCSVLYYANPNTLTSGIQREFSQDIWRARLSYQLFKPGSSKRLFKCPQFTMLNELCLSLTLTYMAAFDTTLCFIDFAQKWGGVIEWQRNKKDRVSGSEWVKNGCGWQWDSTLLSPILSECPSAGWFSFSNVVIFLAWNRLLLWKRSVL